MAGESMAYRPILLLFFIMKMVSTASVKDLIKETNDNSSALNTVCVVAPSPCAYGICQGGTCAPCAFNPLLCCTGSGGRCTTAGGADAGSCTPSCTCYSC